MKSIRKFFIVIILAAIPAMMMGQDKNKKTETVKFKTSIDCENCVNRIMTNLPHEKGIRDVKCDLTTKEVAVTYQKDKNNTEGIIKAIEKLGYTAKPVAATDNSVKKPN